MSTRWARFKSSSDGFSLAEVTLAVGLLSFAAVGVAQLFTVAGSANRDAKSQTSTAILAVQKMEQLRGLAWGYVEGAGGAVGVPVSDFTTNLTVDPPASNGTGLSASPLNALDSNTAGYVDYLDAGGNWVGTGAAPVAGTVYIRRWSIQPLAGDPGNTLILQVLVTPLRRELLRKAGARGRFDDDTRLVSVKTRKAR